MPGRSFKHFMNHLPQPMLGITVSDCLNIEGRLGKGDYSFLCMLRIFWNNTQVVPVLDPEEGKEIYIFAPYLGQQNFPDNRGLLSNVVDRLSTRQKYIIV